MSSQQPPNRPGDPFGKPGTRNLFSANDPPPLPEESRKRQPFGGPGMADGPSTNVMSPADRPAKPGAPAAPGGPKGPTKHVKRKPSEKPPRDGKAVLDLLVALVILVLAGTAYAYRAAPMAGFVSLEAFHDLAYSRSLALDQGLTFFGKTALAFDDFLWVVLMAAGGALFGDMPALAQYAGLAFGGATMLLLAFMSRGLLGRWWPGALAALGLAINEPFVAWAASGTDAGFFAFLFTLALWAFAREVKRGKILWSGLLWGLLATTRPDAVWLSAGPALIALWTMLFGGNKTRAHSLGWLVLLALPLAGVGWMNLQMSNDLLIHPLPDFSPWEADPLGTLMASPAWEGLRAFWSDYPALVLILLISSALTLERGPRRSAPAFAAMMLAAFVYVAAMFALGRGGGVLHRNLAPLLPLAYLVAFGGVAMLLHHGPTKHHWPAAILQFFLVVGSIGAIGAATLPSNLERGLMAKPVLNAKMADLAALADLGDAEADASAEAAAADSPAGAAPTWRDIASPQAAALAFYLEKPVLDLSGRHVIEEEARNLHVGGEINLAKLDEWGVKRVHMPFPRSEANPLFRAGDPSRRTVALYYSQGFHQRFERAEPSAETSPAFYSRRAEPMLADASAFPAGLFDAALEAELPRNLRLGSPAFARFVVRNASGSTYPASGSLRARTGDMAVSVSWFSIPEGASEPAKGAEPFRVDEFALPRPLPSGESVDFVRELPLPDADGTFRVAVGLALKGAGSVNARAKGLALDFDLSVGRPALGESFATGSQRKGSAQGKAAEKPAPPEAAPDKPQPAAETPKPAKAEMIPVAEGAPAKEAAPAPAQPSTAKEMLDSVGSSANNGAASAESPSAPAADGPQASDPDMGADTPQPAFPPLPEPSEGAEEPAEAGQ